MHEAVVALCDLWMAARGSMAPEVVVPAVATTNSGVAVRRSLPIDCASAVADIRCSSSVVTQRTLSSPRPVTRTAFKMEGCASIEA